jgi:hypothetical protein
MDKVVGAAAWLLLENLISPPCLAEVFHVVSALLRRLPVSLGGNPAGAKGRCCETPCINAVMYSWQACCSPSFPLTHHSTTVCPVVLALAVADTKTHMNPASSQPLIVSSARVLGPSNIFRSAENEQDLTASNRKKFQTREASRRDGS